MAKKVVVKSKIKNAVVSESPKEQKDTSFVVIEFPKENEVISSQHYAVKIGASPDGGSTYFLPRLVGYKKTMEMIMLPDRFDAETARLHGLVNWVVPNEKLAAETARIAQRLAAGPTRAYAEAKRLVNQSLDPLNAQMEQELQAFSRCARGPDLKEGVTAFVEKRKPVFTGK